MTRGQSCTTPFGDKPDAASVSRVVWRYRSEHGIGEDTDTLAAEAPLEIRVRGKAVCVTMRTPSCGTTDGEAPEDHELAAGFLLSEGVVREAEDIERIAPCTRSIEGDVVNAFLAPHVEYDEERLTRHVFASSSCGVCGKATIDAVLGDFEPLIAPAADAPPLIDAQVLAILPDRLRECQHVFSRTGGLHAAAVFDCSGNLLVVREDVGRHNAVDKALGYLLLNNQLPLRDHVLLVSGRVSFEITQKALAARIPVVAAVSAPSSLAAEFAEDSGQTLAGFVRDGRFNLYTHPRRVNIHVPIG